MRSNLMTVLAGASLAAALACAPAEEPAATTQEEPAATNAEDLAAIGEVSAMEAAGVGSGDVEAAVAAYADGIVFMSPDAPALNGKDAVRGWITSLWEQFDLNVVYTTSDVIVSGDWAIERYGGEATFTPKDGGDPLVEQLKGIHIYQRQADGSWKITHDIWNSDAPPPM